MNAVIKPFAIVGVSVLFGITPAGSADEPFDNRIDLSVSGETMPYSSDFPDTNPDKSDLLLQRHISKSPS